MPNLLLLGLIYKREIPLRSHLCRPFLSRLFAAAALVALAITRPVAAESPVVVVEAQERDMMPQVQVAGTVISRNDTRLAAQVEGQVTWVADVGTVLGSGEAAARLDDILVREALSESVSRVQREQASVTFNEAEVKRLERLAADSHAAQSHLDQARRDLAFARSELVAARARASQAEERLERTQIRTPFAGVVSERFIQAGEWADSGTAIVRLVDTTTLEAQAWIPLRSLPFLHQGADVVMEVEGARASGKVRTVVPVGDDRSRLYELRLTLEGEGWSAGQSVRISVPTALPQRLVSVPRDALVLRRDNTAVFRVREDNTVEKVIVTTGIAQGDWIAVDGPIQPGDRIVIRGGERLRDGKAVSVSAGSDG